MRSIPSWWRKTERRGREASVQMPRWWVWRARKWLQRQNDNDGGNKSDEQIGVELAQLIKRPDGFDHATISRFRRGVVSARKKTVTGSSKYACTLELAVALCVAADLEWPVFFARSADESRALERTANDFNHLDQEPELDDSERELMEKIQASLAKGTISEGDAEAFRFSLESVLRKRGGKPR